MNHPKSIAIVGGNSSIARLLRASHLPQALSFVRNDGHPNVRRVSAYDRIVPEDLQGIGTVINCAGAVDGDSETLEKANVALPTALANACREAGVARLVHISSFSVYGQASHIDAATQPDPRSPYGRSKLAGDEALLANAGDGLDCVVVRLPAILHPGNADTKVARMLRLWHRIGRWPVPAGDVERSMISSAMTAHVLAKVAGERHSGVVLAADPVPFRYELARRVIERHAGKPIRTVPTPEWALSFVQKLSPGLHANLFADSLLAQGSNYAASFPSDLEETLGVIVSGEGIDG